ncbi:MAG: phosphoenolpyruvate-utilizing N-terminal domain-containing protein, partial [Lawsonibacter sp.]
MILKGVGASPGAAVANIYRINQLDLTVDQHDGCEPEVEEQRYKKALVQALCELDALYEKTAVEDTAAAQVFEIHKLMLDDPDLSDGVGTAIRAGHNAEYAVQSTADALAGFLESLENEVMRGRAADVRDVSGRLIRILKGVEESGGMPEGTFVVLAEDLLPSQTVRLDRQKVVGFVTKRGSVTSHSVILAKTMGIPCIVGLGDDYDRLPERGEIAIDGVTGEVAV